MNTDVFHAFRRVLPAALMLAGLVLVARPGPSAAAQAQVGLGIAGAFAVLADSSITNTGPSVIKRDLGVSPGTALTGFPPGIVNGTTYAATRWQRRRRRT